MSNLCSFNGLLSKPAVYQGMLCIRLVSGISLNMHISDHWFKFKRKNGMVLNWNSWLKTLGSAGKHLRNTAYNLEKKNMYLMKIFKIIFFIKYAVIDVIYSKMNRDLSKTKNTNQISIWRSKWGNVKTSKNELRKIIYPYDETLKYPFTNGTPSQKRLLFL
jgi:hypothetical protein